MAKGKIDLPLPTLDDLFSTQEMRDEAKLEKIKELPLEELHPFKDHPFKVQDDEEMEKIMESISNYGVLTPALARPLESGGYELISGHRRLAACQALGVEKMPVIVRDLDDDEAVIAMVDANLQREKILPSEKAFAFKMKRDALQHQGRKTSPQLGERLLTVEKVGEKSGDSQNQVLRYIRLTELLPDLLQKVDEGRVAFSPAVELSFLTEDEQQDLLDAMAETESSPSLAQAIRLKKASQEGLLTRGSIREIMREEKPNQHEQIRFRRTDFGKFFPKNYTEEQIKKDILTGLELLKKQRERSRDAR